MLAVVWTNPEKPQSKQRSIERQIVDGRELIVVNGTDLWTVLTGRPQLKCAGGL
jgi:hypothetical protein